MLQICNAGSVPSGLTTCIVVTAGTSNAQLTKKFFGLAVYSHLALSTVHSDGVQLYQHCQGPCASISLRESILQTCSSLNHYYIRAQR